MTNSQEKIKHIIIVGGGSSGWMAASYIGKSLNFNVKITLIDSPSIKRIGVGEATVPTIKTEFFDQLGLAEADWMPHCQGTYKLGIKYINWKKSPKQGGDYYYHNFGEIPAIGEIPLTHIWIKKRLEENFKLPMDYACFDSPMSCDLNKSPRYLDGTRVQHYAYHFDALELADFLCNWSINHGVQRITDELATAEQDEEGNITCVVSKTGKKYFADLFIDCTGFSALLIEKTLKEPIVSFADSLLTDSAISINLPETPEVDGIRPFTSATALNAGWVWEIPLYRRSGNGYVYSSQFISDEEAEREVRKKFGKRGKEANTRVIKFQSRRRRNSWVKNCVSIGLASSFLEPLESTGLYFVYAALYQLTRNFPNKQINPIFRDKFNKKVRFMVEDAKDFIVMHFKTSLREDTPFWKANKYDTKIPDSLQLILDRQRAGIPIRKSHQVDKQLYDSFSARFENFWTNSSYQCILCGVNWLPKYSLPLLNYRDDIVKEGNKIIMQIQKRAKMLAKTLPGQYEYLKTIHESKMVKTNKSKKTKHRSAAKMA